MPDPSPVGAQTADHNPAGIQSKGGGVLPMFKRGRGRPNILSTEDHNAVKSAVNSLLSMQVKVSSGTLPDGSNPGPSGKLILSDLNAILEIFLGSEEHTSELQST